MVFPIFLYSEILWVDVATSELRPTERILLPEVSTV